MSNIFEVRAEAMKNKQVVSPLEAIKVVYDGLDYVQYGLDELEFGTYQDQDGYHHLVVKSEYYDEKQLHEVYTTTYLTGYTCGNRSKLYWQKKEATLEVEINGVTCKVDSITVASVLQYQMVRPSDMRLMSNILAWLHSEVVA
jgi:hypothetical protein